MISPFMLGIILMVVLLVLVVLFFVWLSRIKKKGGGLRWYVKDTKQ